MEKRRLGRTGHMSSVVIFGSAAFWEIDQESANAALDLALAAGINHIDVAPQYGQAEERVGPWLEAHREEFFVGCKTMERTRAGAWSELQRSLTRLHTDHLELYQLHAVTDFEELDAAMEDGGAIEALQEAREQGVARYLGITGHGLLTPQVFIKALERFDFDSVMFPINAVLYANADYRAATEELLALCDERDVAVMVIKAIAKGPWGDQDKDYNTWYQPYDAQQRINESVRFALSQHPVAAIPSAGDTRLLPRVIQAAEQFTPMSADEQAALIDSVRQQEPLFTY